MEIKKLKRLFKFNPSNNDPTVELSDPNPAYTTEEVIDHYSNQYPELSNCVVVPEGASGECFIYELKTTLGLKG